MTFTSAFHIAEPCSYYRNLTFFPNLLLLRETTCLRLMNTLLFAFSPNLDIGAVVMRTTYQVRAAAQQTESGFILSPSNEGCVSAGACFGLLANILIGTVWQQCGTVPFAFGCERGNPQLSVTGIMSRKKVLDIYFAREGHLKYQQCSQVGPRARGKWRYIGEVRCPPVCR